MAARLGSTLREEFGGEIAPGLPVGDCGWPLRPLVGGGCRLLCGNAYGWNKPASTAGLKPTMVVRPGKRTLREALVQPFRDLLNRPAGGEACCGGVIFFDPLCSRPCATFAGKSD